MSAPRALKPNQDGTPMIRRPVRIFDAFTSGMNSLGTFWVFCLMFLICADIIGRYFFNYPIRGVSEIIGYSIVTAVFLQFANTLNAGRFTRAELLIDWLIKRRPVAGRHVGPGRPAIRISPIRPYSGALTGISTRNHSRKRCAVRRVNNSLGWWRRERQNRPTEATR